MTRGSKNTAHGPLWAGGRLFEKNGVFFLFLTVFGRFFVFFLWKIFFTSL